MYWGETIRKSIAHACIELVAALSPLK